MKEIEKYHKKREIHAAFLEDFSFKYDFPIYNDLFFIFPNTAQVTTLLNSLALSERSVDRVSTKNQERNCDQMTGSYAHIDVKGNIIIIAQLAHQQIHGDAWRSLEKLESELFDSILVDG